MGALELTGRVALVTGATSGIGAATAVLLAQRGAHVLVHGRNGSRGESVVAAVRDHGGKADFVAADLREAPSVRQLARRAVDLGGGRVDLLVNNAGIYPLGPTERTTENEIDAVHAVNVKAPFLLVADLAPAMAERGSGAIVNVSTMVAAFGMADTALYGSSKAAVELLTKAWAAEYGPRGVRVNAVRPGPTRTEGTAGMSEALDALAARAPAGRPIRRRSPRRSPTWPATRQASSRAPCSPWTAAAPPSDGAESAGRSAGRDRPGGRGRPARCACTGTAGRAGARARTSPWTTGRDGAMSVAADSIGRMADTTAFDWRSFLLRWSEEWADSLSADETRSEDDEAARRARWLGFPPASEERITALEERLGRRLPPSYREFLKVSDGWRHAGGFVRLLAGTEDAHWHNNASGLAGVFEDHRGEDAGSEERRQTSLWWRGLQLDVESDVTYVLLDPGDVDEDGEWAVYTWSSWLAAPPERHANFREFMRDMYREFHSLRANRDDGKPFVNDTTRTLDALVEEARLEALRGGWERARRALDEARGYGRPRAAGLGDQIRRLLGQTSMVYFDGLLTDPRYASELLPPLVAEHAAHSYRDDSALTLHLRGADDALVTLARTLLDQVRNGTYRYTATGPFGEAVEQARELARWGDTDGAWRALMNALPLWEPLGPDHLAPLGWVADPLLGPLLTPERGRELLSTPRGGQTGRAPAPSAGLDPDGLAWLAEPDPGNKRTSYRFVLVEGVGPEELPGRLADGDGTVLSEPMTFWEAHHKKLDGRREFSSYEDRALMAVGRAGDGWSFAFDGDPAPFLRQRFVSPAVAASAGTRAVVVWSGLRSWYGEPFFHLSVAQDGAEQYAFTYADGEIQKSGEIPRALDPDRFFAGPEGGTDAERPLLEAVTEEFGVRLPRHAIVRGRLHTFTTRSWTRPPGEGETYAVLRML